MCSVDTATFDTVSEDGLTGYAAVGGETPSLKTIDIARGAAIHSTPLGEAPSTTALLWLNQVLVALSSHAHLDTYDTPSRLSRSLGLEARVCVYAHAVGMAPSVTCCDLETRSWGRWCHAG